MCIILTYPQWYIVITGSKKVKLDGNELYILKFLSLETFYIAHKTPTKLFTAKWEYRRDRLWMQIDYIIVAHSSQLSYAYVCYRVRRIFWALSTKTNWWRFWGLNYVILKELFHLFIYLGLVDRRVTILLCMDRSVICRGDFMRYISFP